MSPLKIWLTASVAACALTACSKPAEKAAGEAKPASAAAPADLTMPKRKAGLWEQTMEMASAAGGPGMHQVSTLCVDPASEGEMAAMGLQMSKDIKCTEQRVTRTATGMEFSSVCPMGDSGTVASKGVMTGDFNASYKMDMVSTTTGAASEHMNGERRMTMTAVWKGPCPPDMKPGDIRLSGVPGMPAGATFNPAEMAKAGQMPSAADMEALKARAQAMRKQQAGQ